MTDHLQKALPWIGATILALFTVGVALGPVLQMWYYFTGATTAAATTNEGPFDRFDAIAFFTECKPKDTPFLFGPAGTGGVNTHSQTGCWSAGWQGTATGHDILAKVENQLKGVVEKHGWRLDGQSDMSIAVPGRGNQTKQFSCWGEEDKRRGEIYVAISVSTDNVTTLTVTYTVPLPAH